MTLLGSLFVNVHLLDPLSIIHVLINLALSTQVGVNASEVGRAPHFVGIELVGASKLISISSGRIVYTVEEGISCLEAELAIEVVTMGVPHEVEAIVCKTHL